MIPKIDYRLIGEAVRFYSGLDYEYVEVPWLVTDAAIMATLPAGADSLKVGVDAHPSQPDMLVQYYSGESSLVGSAEQGLIQLQLKPGRYFGITPCFRVEDRLDLLTRDTFMKVELFDNSSEEGDHKRLLKDAHLFFEEEGVSSKLRIIDTAEGQDIQLAGVEIGSYGVREHPDFGRWVYGTGLALPRFSVAKALASVL